MNVNTVFGKRLKQIRDDLGLTQEEFAFKCDMQPSHIGQLERGAKSPTLQTLMKIAAGIQVSVSLLLDFQEELVIPDCFDETTNKIIARLNKLEQNEKKQILAIVKAMKK